MSRLLQMVRTDALLQLRNNLYALSVGVSVIIGAALAWLSPAEQVARTVPMALLFIVGGSTLLYVVGLIILERDDGTLAAVAVSPLRPSEYLASKVITLTGLATLEGTVVSLLGLAAIAWRAGVSVAWPSPLGLLGLAALGVMHVLIGVIVVARHDRFSEVLIPMSAIAVVLQLPAFYYVGALSTPLLLLIPSGAPTMLIRGAFVPLSAWEWAYGLGATAVLLAALSAWALRAFEQHLIEKVRG